MHPIYTPLRTLTEAYSVISLLTNSVFSRFDTPELEKGEWTILDKELKTKLHPIHYHLGRATDKEDVTKLGSMISETIAQFAKDKPEVFEKAEIKPNANFVKHQSKTMLQLKEHKKTLQRQMRTGCTQDVRKKFWEACRAISDLKRQEKKKEEMKTTVYQEGLFRKNPWAFSKSVCRGEYGKEQFAPTFSKETANLHYTSNYSTEKTTNLRDIHWFPDVQKSPDDPDFIPFNMAPIRPRDVTSVLKLSNHKSSPGPDGIPYGILYHLPSTHHILATLYNKVLATNAVPSDWGESIIKLIYKKGTTDDPGNFRPIALSNTIVKTFHLILAHRSTSYLMENKLIDPSIQKAFLPGISGCTEHNAVMEELIKHVRSNKLTAHIAFFDLADAFGSIPHDLILHTLSRNHFPQQVQEYIRSLYSVTRSKVVTKSFQSDPFYFRKGVTQGDPLSPIIFILTFQPIIDFIKENDDYGVTVNGEKVITLPFADDFCLITRNKITQQRLISEINSHIQSMGMKLKPSKCRAFSIRSGKPSIVPFYIGNQPIPSIAHEEQKFLGKVIFFSGKSKDTLNYLHDTFKERLDHIDNTQIRGENKLWIYEKYFLPSIRFLLTVHDLNVTNVEKLDALTHRYLKKWAGIPKCGTNLIFHMKEGMGIPTILTLYDTVHSLNHTSMRLKGDKTVNAVLNNAIERESQFTRKKSTVVRSQEVHDWAVNTNCVDGEMPQFSDPNCDREKVALTKQIKKSVKARVNNDAMEAQHVHLQTLMKQGESLQFLHAQQEDPTWKGYIYSLKKGTMKFILNSNIHTLPTMNNLKLWSKASSDKCHLCGNRDNTHHCLSNCKVSLDQKRYTWRHDNLIRYIVDSVDTDRFTVFSDIPGFQTPNGGSIPASMAITTLKPDVVIVDENSKKVNMFELTVNWESNSEKNNTYKSNKYAHFLSDITTHSPTITPFEVGVRGHISKDNLERIRNLHYHMKKSIKLKTFTNNLSALAINSSFYIFTCRKEPSWSQKDYLSPPF